MARSMETEKMDIVLAQARVPTELRDTPPLEWTTEDVTSWLRSLGLDRHVEKFAEEGVDGMSLFDITEEELTSESLINQIGSRKKFIRFVRKREPKRRAEKRAIDRSNVIIIASFAGRAGTCFPPSRSWSR